MHRIFGNRIYSTKYWYIYIYDQVAVYKQRFISSQMNKKQLKTTASGSGTGGGGWRLEADRQRGNRHGLITESPGSGVEVNQAFLEWSVDCWIEPRCALLCSLLTEQLPPILSHCLPCRWDKKKGKQPKQNHSHNLYENKNHSPQQKAYRVDISELSYIGLI